MQRQVHDYRVFVLSGCTTPGVIMTISSPVINAWSFKRIERGSHLCLDRPVRNCVGSTKSLLAHVDVPIEYRVPKAIPWSDDYW
eukprot:2234173-Pleurochrysis_carterae.AAC.1